MTHVCQFFDVQIAEVTEHGYTGDTRFITIKTCKQCGKKDYDLDFSIDKTIEIYKRHEPYEHKSK